MLVLTRRQNIWCYTAQHTTRRGASHGQISTIKATQDAYGASWRRLGRWPVPRPGMREKCCLQLHAEFREWLKIINLDGTLFSLHDRIQHRVYPRLQKFTGTELFITYSPTLTATFFWIYSNTNTKANGKSLQVQILHVYQIIILIQKIGFSCKKRLHYLM